MSLQISQSILASLDEMGVQIDTDRGLELVDGGTLVINYEGLRPDGEKHIKFKRFGIRLLPPKYIADLNKVGWEDALDSDIVLVGGQIKSEIKQALRVYRVPYIDLRGSEIFINTIDLKLWLNTKTRSLNPVVSDSTIIPTTSDLKLFRYILSNPQSPNQLTQRHLAEVADISLGACNNSLKRFQDFVHLITNGHENHWMKLDKYLRTFATAYSKNQINWAYSSNRFDRKSDLFPDNTKDYCISGGNAAQQMGLDIYSPDLVIYTRMPLSETMRLFKLVPSANGSVRVASTDWSSDIEQPIGIWNPVPIAPWLVFLADLLNSEDVRVQGLFEAAVRRYIETMLMPITIF